MYLIVSTYTLQATAMFYVFFYYLWCFLCTLFESAVARLTRLTSLRSHLIYQDGRCCCELPVVQGISRSVSQRHRSPPHRATVRSGPTRVYRAPRTKRSAGCGWAAETGATARAVRTPLPHHLAGPGTRRSERGPTTRPRRDHPLPQSPPPHGHCVAFPRTYVVVAAAVVILGGAVGRRPLLSSSSEHLFSA